MPDRFRELVPSLRRPVLIRWLAAIFSVRDAFVTADGQLYAGTGGRLPRSLLRLKGEAYYMMRRRVTEASSRSLLLVKSGPFPGLWPASSTAETRGIPAAWALPFL